LFRILLTGAAALLLSSATFSIAGAAESDVSPAAAVTVSTAGSDAGHISSRLLTAVEAAAPTDGADLAMWGVSAGHTAQSASSAAVARLTHGASPMRRLASGIIERSASLAMNLTQHAMRFLGVPYVFGGTSTSGFDCSGYVQHVFAMLGVHLPRTADAQYYAGHRIAGNMVAGDLVFFQTYEAGPSHVGIYLGNDRFVHASSSHGVTVSSLHDSYWAARYLGAKRFI
jgi:cell wall-associated NlpC family hydrolase